MNRVALIVAVACLVSTRAQAGCTDPGAAPPPPDGAKVSREEMLAAQKAFRDYDTAVREYASCLQQTGGSGALQNAAVKRVELAAEKFNAELRAFKKRGAN
jgi:hypothetical protein